MHTLESYALNSGAKISKPHIVEKFFPTTLDKYITLDCDARSPSKHYDFWQEVVDILGPVLSKEDITILQIGREKDPGTQGTYSIRGQTNINQSAYLIKNALLHVGPDNEFVDIASHYNKKIVALYGNCLPSHFSPYWSKELEVSLLQPKRKAKPCYTFEEDPKTINKITPAEITKQICRHLNLDFDFPYEYSYIGERYNEPKINLIPTAPLTEYRVPDIPISIRADLSLNEDAIAKTLQLGAFEIVTNKPLNPQLVTAFRSRIKNIIYIVEEENEPNFVRFLMNNAISYRLVSFLDDNELNPIKLNYMDFGTLIGQKVRTKEEVEEKATSKPTHYKSNKFVLSDGKFYPSLAAWKQGLNVGHLKREPQLIIDDPDLWKEADNYCFLSLT